MLWCNFEKRNQSQTKVGDKRRIEISTFTLVSVWCTRLSVQQNDRVGRYRNKMKWKQMCVRVGRWEGGVCVYVNKLQHARGIRSLWTEIIFNLVILVFSIICIYQGYIQYISCSFLISIVSLNLKPLIIINFIERRHIDCIFIYIFF